MTYDWAMIKEDIEELYVVRKYKAEDVLVFLRQDRSLNIKNRTLRQKLKEWEFRRVDTGGRVTKGVRIASPASASSSPIPPMPRVRHAPARTLPSHTAPIESNIRHQRVAGDQSLYHPLSMGPQQGLLKLKSSRTNSGWDDFTDEEAAFLDAESRDGAALKEHGVAAGARMQPSRPQFMTDSAPMQTMPAPPYNLATTRWRRNDSTEEALDVRASHSVARPTHSAYTSPIATNARTVQASPCHKVCYECAVPHSNDLQDRHFEPCTHRYCPSCAMSFAPRDPAPSAPCWPVTCSNEDWAGNVQHIAERLQASVHSLLATPESTFRQSYEGYLCNMRALFANFDHNPPTLTPSSGDKSKSSYSVSTPLPQQGIYRDTAEDPQPFARDAFPPAGANLTAFAYGGQECDQPLTSQNDLLSLQTGFPNNDLFLAHPAPESSIQNALSRLPTAPATFAFGANDMADFSFPSDSPIPLPQLPQGQVIYQNTLRQSVDEIWNGATFSIAQSTLTASSLGVGQCYPQENTAPAMDLNAERNVIGETPGMSGETSRLHLDQTFMQNPEDVETADCAARHRHDELNVGILEMYGGCP